MWVTKWRHSCWHNIKNIEKKWDDMTNVARRTWKWKVVLRLWKCENFELCLTCLSGRNTQNCLWRHQPVKSHARGAFAFLVSVKYIWVKNTSANIQVQEEGKNNGGALEWLCDVRLMKKFFGVGWGCLGIWIWVRASKLVPHGASRTGSKVRSYCLQVER